jgi:hypothetical protein
VTGDGRAVRRAAVPAQTPWQVGEDLAAALRPGPDTLVMAFVSSELDPSEVAAALAQHLAPGRVVGCTSFGELAGAAKSGTAVALALDGRRVRWGVGVADLTAGPLEAGRRAVVEAAAELGLAPAALDPTHHVAVTLVDGRAATTEGFCLGSAATAPRIAFVGGAASDHLPPRPDQRDRERRAAIFDRGGAHHDRGLVVVLAPAGSFEVISSQHMIATTVRTVVTGADPSRRVVFELDGHPAARRYDELIRGLGANGPLDVDLASRFPFAVHVDGRPYVRSISGLADDELHLAAAIDEGAVVRIMQPGDLIGQTRSALRGAQGRVGAVDAILAFSCLGRHREAMARGAGGALDDIYASIPVCGFHSFGEQIGPLLVNHTLAALALGSAHG